MKKLILAIGLALAAFASSRDAQGAAVKELYQSRQQIAATNEAQVIFPAENTKAIRLVWLNAQSDLPTAKLSILSGLTRYAITGMNNSTGIWLSATSGLALGNAVVLQKSDDTLEPGKIGSLSATGLGFVASFVNTFTNGDFLYLMQTNVTLNLTNPYGATQFEGESLGTVARRAPVHIKVSGTSAALIGGAVVHYDELP